MRMSPSSPGSASTTITSYVPSGSTCIEKNPCKHGVCCPYASLIPFAHDNMSRSSPHNCTRATLRACLRVTWPEQRKCLTLTAKPSLIDGIPLHGGGRRVQKSGVIDATCDATPSTKRETDDAHHMSADVVAGDVRHGRRVVVVGPGCVN